MSTRPCPTWRRSPTDSPRSTPIRDSPEPGSSLLRDGFALAVNDVNPSFAALAAELHLLHGSLDLNRHLDDPVAHILGGFAELRCHPDVAVGIHALSALGLRLMTLTNGATSVAQRLLNDAGLIDAFELLLSAEQAGLWNPDPRAYALSRCGVQAAEAMLVTVHPWDTDGARRAGLSAAWVNRTGVDYPSYFGAPSVEMESLVDLVDRLS